MRIVILGTRGFPNIQGGVEKHCEGLAVSLVKLGCEVIVFTRKPYVKNNIKKIKGVKLVDLPAVRHKSLEAFLHTFIGVFAALRYNPDILHIQAIGPSLFTPLARLLGMKVVVTSHGPNYKHLKWGKFAKLVLRLGEFLGIVFANEVIAITKIIADELEEKYKRKATIIANGVIISPIATSKNALTIYNLEKRKYILTVGRFVPEKGFRDLIDGFNMLQSPNYRLVIVGDADHEDKYSLGLKEKARENSNIVLTGFISGEPLHQLYSHAGLFVLPSYYEGLPIVLLEALSYGLPVLVSDIPANKEVELPTERYFRCGDVDDLKEKMEVLLEKGLSEEERREIQRQIEEKYNWDRIAAQTIKVYRKALVRGA
jgi:glycosyltransferase involved in cell wall biosynthesis